jgi:hypothetical protein
MVNPLGINGLREIGAKPTRRHINRPPPTRQPGFAQPQPRGAEELVRFGRRGNSPETPPKWGRKSPRWAKVLTKWSSLAVIARETAAIRLNWDLTPPASQPSARPLAYQQKPP